MATNKARRVVVIVSLVIILTALSVLLIKPYVNYSIACENESKEEYAKAIELFEKLGDYRDSSTNIERCKYEWATNLLSQPTDEHYKQAIELLKEIPQYADSHSKQSEAVLSYAKSLRNRFMFEESIVILKTIDTTDEVIDELNATKYAFAMHLFESGELTLAKDYWEQVGNYGDSKALLQKTDFLLSIQGEYQGNKSYMKTTIAGCTMYHILETRNGNYVYEFAIDGEKIDPVNRTFQAASSDYLAMESAYFGVILQERRDGDLVAEYRRTQTTPSVPVTDLKKEPALGMTTDDVRNSTWGEPENINRTTTKYGVREQWVYPDYKYIYFDDGIVTAIQD